MAEKDSLRERALSAADAYLERAGMQVLDVEYKTPHGRIPIVAIDGDTLVRVHVSVLKKAPDTGDGMPSARTVETYSRQLTYWQRVHQTTAQVRFDEIRLLVISEDRAVLRHHRDAYR